MSNTIEILDKDTNTKQTYVLKEKPEQIEYSLYFELLKKLLKGTMELLKCGLYVAISFIELIIKIIKVLFNLNDYKPFQSLIDIKDNLLNGRAEKQIDKYKVKFATEHLTRHTYEFERSDLYNDTYKYIQEKLKAFADNNVAINQDIYRDILNKIDILTVEVEKKALQEGYSYASFTKYRLQDDDIFNDYIQYKIMRGEGHGKVDKEQRASRNW